MSANIEVVGRMLPENIWLCVIKKNAILRIPRIFQLICFNHNQGLEVVLKRS